MKLCVEEPYKDVVEYNWSLEMARKFDLDAGDIQMMRKGETIFQGDTAYTLEGDD